MISFGRPFLFFLPLYRFKIEMAKVCICVPFRSQERQTTREQGR